MISSSFREIHHFITARSLRNDWTVFLDATCLVYEATPT
jgi:hypothetical protein